ncbi:hypothetical protein D3P07_14085 [Paenibacillus sp. 1011MAR3C5]|nr:hypothetical protein D3P07_14085 [Paenibacillus sp. 1011MAR3C5]
MWCWRCKSDMPMLDEEECAQIDRLFGDAMKNDGVFREEYGLPMSQLSMVRDSVPLLRNMNG